MMEQILQKNLAAVEERLAAACGRAGRARSEVALVAVTKTVSAEASRALAALRNVRVKGLMTMAALQDPQACRPTFALLRKLRDRLRAELDAPHTLEHLSMGMSNDFEVAVEEGATLIRVGTLLFQGLKT